uniref:Uncharacterized protein n=1 Tax=Odontella aurita TaxID=265563 RepID=A0A7S4NAU6_9STRA
MSQANVLVVPALASGKDSVEARLGHAESHRRGSSSDRAAQQVRGAVLDPHNVDEEVLIGEVGRVGPDEEARGSSDGHREGRVRFAVLVRRFVDVFHESRQTGANNTQGEGIEKKTT